MKDKLSVIVPIYNVEPYIHRCIDSIINQTYRNLEIILVDDESPDNCGLICDEYAAKDNRIKVIHRKNGGLSCARNSGLKIATGDYIAYVDSDDHIHLEMFAKMMHYILKFKLEVVEVEPWVSRKNKVYDNSFNIEDPVTATKRILRNTSFSVWRRIFKKSLVGNMRFLPGLIHQDVFYTMDMLKKIKLYGYLNCPLYYYNTENVSIIRSKYTLEKIRVGIRATEYIIKNVLNLPSLKASVDNYVTHYYTDHYFLLSRNTHIDSNRFYRKKLKKDIKKSLNSKNLNFRSLLVVLFPSRLMEIISSYYEYFKRRKKISKKIKYILDKSYQLTSLILL